MGEVEVTISVVMDSQYEIPFFNRAVSNPHRENYGETVRGRQF